VVAVVACRGDAVLICQRRAGKRHELLWEFPGGKLLPGETLGEAARRELAEELELEVQSLVRYLGSHEDPGATFRLHFVEARVEGEPMPREHHRIAWVTRSQLTAYPLAPGDGAFVEAWRSEAPPFD
jgi:mutator protein MutT